MQTHKRVGIRTYWSYMLIRSAVGGWYSRGIPPEDNVQRQGATRVPSTDANEAARSRAPVPRQAKQNISHQLYEQTSPPDDKELSRNCQNY